MFFKKKSYDKAQPSYIFAPFKLLISNLKGGHAGCKCVFVWIFGRVCVWPGLAAGSDLFVYGLCITGDLQSRGISTGGLCWSEIMVLI